jgi:hypothetical protein
MKPAREQRGGNVRSYLGPMGQFDLFHEPTSRCGLSIGQLRLRQVGVGGVIRSAGVQDDFEARRRSDEELGRTSQSQRWVPHPVPAPVPVPVPVARDWMKPSNRQRPSRVGETSDKEPDQGLERAGAG